MDKLALIKKYFPDLTQRQLEQLAALEDLYRDWNARINVISRRDMEHLYLHHVLHSISIMKVVCFQPGTRIMDVGTGGGFPGIPLAICFPDCHFLLVDSIGKKIKVVRAIADALKLNHVHAVQARAETITEQFDFVLSRAVTALPEFWAWTVDKISAKNQHPIPNGALYLKGGDMKTELSGLRADYQIYELSDYFTEDYLSTKKIVHIYDRSRKNIFSKAKKK